MTDERRQLRQRFLEQAKKCQTANGCAAILMAMNYLIDERPGMANCEELWQAFDRIFSRAERPVSDDSI